MKKSIKEAYYNNKFPKKASSKKTTTNKKTKKIFFSAEREMGDVETGAKQDAQSTPDQSNVEYVYLQIKQIDKNDAEKIKNLLVTSILTYETVYSAKYKKEFNIPNLVIPIKASKIDKFYAVTLPKIVKILKESDVEYEGIENYNGIGWSDTTDSEILTDIKNKISVAIRDAASVEDRERAVKSIEKLKQEVYKAIEENRWDDAVEAYKKVINLVARTYGQQLSPSNVQAIYTQAKEAGIQPTDKGKETNSYWPDGSEKFWPTFVRSGYAWEHYFDRVVVDEPKMRYIYKSAFYKKADAATVQHRKDTQGYKSISDLSLQQKNVIRTGDAYAGIPYAVGFDISDTVPKNGSQDDFFGPPGLLNNLDGTLTDSAVIDNEEWLKRIQELKNNNPDYVMSDNDKKREMSSTEEGRAKLFLEGLKNISTKNNWDSLGAEIQDTGNPIIDYLVSLENVANARLSQFKIQNQYNKKKIAQMITAVVSYNTVGSSHLKKLNYDFKDTKSIFNGFSEFETLVINISDSILNGLNFAISYEAKKEVKAQALNENSISKIFNILERIENIYKDNYIFESYNELIHRHSDNEILTFLKSFGFDLDDNDNNMF